MRWRSPAAIGAAFGLVAVTAVAAVMLGRGQEDGPATLSPTTSPIEVAITSSPSSSQTPSPSVSPSPSASRLPPGTFENAILGYRITLPEGYRLSQARIVTGQENLGSDYYTLQTEQQEREMCQSDSGDVGFPGQARDRDPDIGVGVSQNVRGLSAVEWATTPAVEGGHTYSHHHQVEATTIGGHEAVRLVTDNAAAETTAFVVRANDRIYLLNMPFVGLRAGMSPRWLDEIAKTFEVIPPAPFPSPTATTPPRQAAGALAQALAAAFSAKDADAVARLMPDCWINVVPVTTEGGGALYRSVTLFTQALRERFAADDLIVTVDPAIQDDPRGSGLFFIRSEWKEPARTTHVDMYLSDGDGRWRWFIAAHHEGWPCHTPWVTTPSC